MNKQRAELLPATFNARQEGTLPGMLGIVVDSLGDRCIALSMQVGPMRMAPNGYLHAASVIALADTAAGYGCFAHIPDGASGFTTIEQKSNFLGTALDGRIVATASLVHGGRNTQVWDAIVRDQADKIIALFRCTQMILWPRT